MESNGTSGVEKQYNMRNPAVKRLLREAMEMAAPTEELWAQPLEDNLFEWHFTIRGAPETDFDRGVYHGRIILPPEYPMKPPSIIMLTPSGRFETGVKICLSISSYHPETWRPSWSIRTALVALISFMNTSTPGAIGSLEYPSDDRKALAKKSLTFECATCGRVALKLKQPEAIMPPSQIEASPQQPCTTEDVLQAQDVVVPSPPMQEIITHETTSVPSIPLEIRQPDHLNVMFSRADDNQMQQSRMYGFAFGAIVCAITGLVFRRLCATVFGWDNMFN